MVSVLLCRKTNLCSRGNSYYMSGSKNPGTTPSCKKYVGKVAILLIWRVGCQPNAKISIGFTLVYQTIIFLQNDRWRNSFIFPVILCNNGQRILWNRVKWDNNSILFVESLPSFNENKVWDNWLGSCTGSMDSITKRMYKTLASEI